MATTQDQQRANLAGFRWAQSNTDDSNNNHQDNAWSRFTSSISSYVPLRSQERSDEEEAFYALSRWDRFLGFLLACAGAAVCFLFAFLMLPRIPIQPRKFAMPFSMGSFLFMLGFAILQGPMAYLSHLFSKPRLPFSLAYIISLVLTIYFSVVARSYIGTLICAVVQIVALVVYFVTYFPGGTTTLRYGGQMAFRGAGSLLPV